MSEGIRRNPHKEQHWRQLVERWQPSGLSVRAFCRRHRLAEPTFYAWRRKLRVSNRPTNGTQGPGAVTFLPVHVQDDHTEPAPCLELVFGGGRHVCIPSGFDTATLRALLAVLEDLSC